MSYIGIYVACCLSPKCTACTADSFMPGMSLAAPKNPLSKPLGYKGSIGLLNLKKITFNWKSSQLFDKISTQMSSVLKASLLAVQCAQRSPALSMVLLALLQQGT